MENEIYEFVMQNLFKHIVIITIAYAGVIIAMCVDFATGLLKAKQRGEARTSTSYKMTATKGKKYFTPMMVLSVIDFMGSVVIPIPVFTMIWGVYCVFCEFVSVREKSWAKAELRKAAKTMSVVIENKDDIAKILAEMVFKKGTENESTN